MFNVFRHSFTTVLWSEVSKIKKEVSNPILSINLLKIRTQIEWNVPIHISCATSPTIPSTLCFISLAALFVKVMARILYGFTFFSDIKYAILCVNTFVFPLPAPAITKHGPSVANTASFCLSFKPSIKSCICFPLSIYLYFCFLIIHIIKIESQCFLLKLLFSISTLRKFQLAILTYFLLLSFFHDISYLLLELALLKQYKSWHHLQKPST